MQKSYFRSYALMMCENQPWIMRKLMSMDFGKFDDGSIDMAAFYEAMNNPTEENWNGWKTENDKMLAIWDAFFKKHDFVICPVTNGCAFRKCELGTAIPIDGEKVAYSSYVIPYSTVFAATGHPTATIPMGLNKEGLPIGLQIVGN